MSALRTPADRLAAATGPGAPTLDPGSAAGVPGGMAARFARIWCELWHPPFRRVFAVEKVTDGAVATCLCLRCGRLWDKRFTKDCRP